MLVQDSEDVPDGVSVGEMDGDSDTEPDDESDRDSLRDGQSVPVADDVREAGKLWLLDGVGVGGGVMVAVSLAVTASDGDGVGGGVIVLVPVTECVPLLLTDFVSSMERL